MKILQLLDEPYDSGLTASALRLAQTLRDARQTCGIVCRENSFAWKKAKQLNLEHVGFSGLGVLAYPKIKNWIKKGGWSILHAHTGRTHTLAWLISKDLKNIRVVRTRADARKLKKRALYQRILKGTDFVVFPTKAMREEFMTIYDYPIGRTKVIYPAVTSETRNQNQESREPSLRVCMVARLDPIKGHRDFIQAAALIADQFPEAVFEIIGAEKNTSIAQLRVAMRRLGVEGRVRVRGFLDDMELGRAMKSSAVGVIASRGSEVISRVCLEWMALGRPVVATKVGMIPEVVKDGKTGFLAPPGCPANMADKIGQLLKDDNLRQAMGQEARELFQKLYSPAVCLEEHLKIYQGIRDKGIGD
ncbi:MAG: glycosyltransferase family 4 protein [Elusimicrobia bacterium]|nr:glycosyltransferase family 4 protein [Elusimicrobiota bacterium]